MTIGQDNDNHNKENSASTIQEKQKYISEKITVNHQFEIPQNDKRNKYEKQRNSNKEKNADSA